MSLKAFHIFFIIVSTAGSLAFGAWAVREYLRENGGTNAALAAGSFLLAIGLLIYGRWFLQKLRGVE